MKKFFCLLSFVLLSSFEEPESLKVSDINRVMSEILTKNENQKEMTTALLKQGFANYITQADPFHIFLLEDEVKPWLNIDEFELQHVLAAYKKQDYSKFTDLNTVIQTAMKRANEIRKQDYSKSALLFEQQPKEIPTTFAKTLDDLKERQTDAIVWYIEAERKKFGNKKVLEKQQYVLNSYETKLRSFEADYLYLDSFGHPLPADQKESLFVMHVLKALTSAIDSHSSFMTPLEALDMKQRLEKEYKGIGVTFKEGIDGIYIDKVFPGSPAAKSKKIEADDRLISIDNQPIEHLTIKDVIEKIDFDPNKEVTLTLIHEGNTVDVTVHPEPLTITEDRVDSQYEPFGNGIIGILKLDSFYDNNQGISSSQDLREAIQHLENIGNLKGLILDLRDNHGGFVTQGVKVAGLFITNGVVVISHYNNGEEKFYRDIDGKVAFDGPLVVLVSRQTASAAEIAAQALQDYGVAVVVGDDHTYGKGSIQSQTVTDNPGSNYFKVTIGKYYTVSGKTPEKHGVQSDVVVPGPLSVLGFEGEGSTDPSSDHIAPAFQDNLKDVPPDAKQWFLKYYTPTVQQPTDYWKKWLPFIKKNSAYRIENNKNYQFFLKKSKPEDDKDETMEEEAVLHKGTKNSGVVDLQLQEAKNVLKDMIQVQQTHGLKSPALSPANPK